ncbi:hypothetical protein ACFOYU_11030 [Microvirga sp. GCM10011540]|uniref:hypothetical protein n=1 Tax=Microvirga sp. GCM10011540 TaxID=3317338 RepID=UPI003618EC49
MRALPPSGAWRGAAALLLVLAAASPLAAQDEGFSPVWDPDERQQMLEPPLPLPEGSIGTVHPQDDATPLRRVDKIREVFQAIQACWKPSRDKGYSGQELTLRVTFKRNGEVLGPPRATYYKAGKDGNRREAFTRSVGEAFERCTPLPFTDGLGAAIAGRPFIFRFVDNRPM